MKTNLYCYDKATFRDFRLLNQFCLFLWTSVLCSILSFLRLLRGCPSWPDLWYSFGTATTISVWTASLFGVNAGFLGIFESFSWSSVCWCKNCIEKQSVSTERQKLPIFFINWRIGPKTLQWTQRQQYYYPPSIDLKDILIELQFIGKVIGVYGQYRYVLSMVSTIPR
jgi:hypothetical protein